MQNFLSRSIALHSRFLVLFLVSLIPTQTASQWVQTNGPGGGRVQCILANGTDLFVAATSEYITFGIYHSTDDGASWAAVCTEKWTIGLAAFAVRGTNLFAGGSSGVYRSTDNGTTWIAANSGLSSGRVQAIAVSGTNLFAGNEHGVFRSTDLGSSWTLARTGLTDTSVLGLAVVGDSLYAGTNGGVFLSTNNGESWIAVNNGLTETPILSLASSGRNLFAGTNYRVYRSTDGGGSWSPANNGLENMYISKLAVSPNGAGSINVFAGTDYGLYRSTDTGASWTLASEGMTDRVVASIAVSGVNLFVGTQNNGVYRSTDNGTGWAPASAGLPQIMVWGLWATPFGPFAEAGRALFRSTDGGKGWVEANSGLTGYVQDLAVMGTNLVAGTTDGIFLSTNGGANWAAVGGSPNAVHSLTVHDSDLFLGMGIYGRVFRSTDRGRTWTTASPYWGLADVEALAFCDSILFAGIYGYDGTPDGIFLTTDNGASWTTSSTVIDARSFVVSGSTIYAQASRGIFRSRDHGKSWTAASAGLGDRLLESLALIPPFDGAVGTCLLAGTYDRGIFVSTNGGETWYPGGSGLARPWVGPFAVQDSTVFAATETGVWKRPLSDLNRGNVTPYLRHHWVLFAYNGQPSSSLLTIANYGTAPLHIDSITVRNATVSLRRSGSFISPGHSITDTVIFAPLVTSHFFDTLTVYNDGEFAAVSWLFECWSAPSGTFTFNTHELDFGELPVGQSMDLAVTISNKTVDWVRLNKWHTRQTYAPADTPFVDLIVPTPAIDWGAQLIDRFRFRSQTPGSFSDTVVYSMLSPRATIMAQEEVYLRATTTEIGIVDDTTHPARFALGQNFPNPFNGTTSIRFEVPHEAAVSIMVYDLLGRSVAVILDQPMKAGRYQRVFDGSPLASGVYFYRLRADNFTQTRKMLIVR